MHVIFHLNEFSVSKGLGLAQFYHTTSNVKGRYMRGTKLNRKVNRVINEVEV